MTYEYDDETLQRINDSVDLLDYVSQSIEMVRSGKEYFGHCPLHVDNTPSFSITPSKNLYYCFSCGRSGGIIKFLMEYENMTFRDAVKKAAKLANVDLSQMCKSETISFLKKCKASTIKKEHSEHKIFDNTELCKYQKGEITEWIQEGIKKDVLDLFDVRLDERANRIVYPVKDINGRIINIKGRTRFKDFKELRIPKYINYYPVGTMDYLQGLDITLPYVRQSNEIILFESVKSVMKAYGWGYMNTASVEKHSLTDEQIRLVVSLRVNVVLAFDTDVDYRARNLQDSIARLKRVTNVYIINDKKKLLGGKETKNSPTDLTQEVWEELYKNKTKII